MALACSDCIMKLFRACFSCGGSFVRLLCLMFMSGFLPRLVYANESRNIVRYGGTKRGGGYHIPTAGDFSTNSRPMGCVKGVVGYGMIHPNLINAAVLLYHGLTSLNQHFDAMALAPNFDLLLTQGSADEIAKLITSWKTDPHTLWAQGEMTVQAPLGPYQGEHEISSELYRSQGKNSSLKD